MKDLTEMEHIAQNVLKIFLFLFLFTACKSNIKLAEKKDYTIEKYKSKKYFFGISIKAYDNFEGNKLLEPTVIINNVFLRGSVFKLGHGYHDIKILYLAKEPITISNLKIESNDSIVIKAYLKDDLIID